MVINPLSATLFMIASLIYHTNLKIPGAVRLRIPVQQKARSAIERALTIRLFF